MIKICSKLCDECPFSNKSMKTWLPGYETEDFVTMFRAETLFPCHKLVKDDITFNECNALVKSGKLKLCRGYAESMRKSGKLPKDPEFAAIIRNVALSDDSMSIFEFFNHHKKEEQQ